METPEPPNANPLDPQLEQQVIRFARELDIALYKMVEYGKTYVQLFREMPRSYPMNELDLQLDKIAQVAETCGVVGCLPLAIENTLMDLIKCITYTVDQTGVICTNIFEDSDGSLIVPTKVVVMRRWRAP